NGPREIAFNLTTDYYTLKVCQTINNESLSYIYNLFINEVESEKYILLDHDSILKYDYVLECLNSTSDCIIPNIIVGNNIQSPKTYSIQSFNKGNTVLAIGSGICISKKLCEKLRQVFGDVFDSRFYFYGVDSTFFLRLNKIGESEFIKISECVVLHSLSRLENEAIKVKQFRIKERSYDQGLTLRYYFCKFTFFTVAKKLLAKLIFNKSDISLIYFAKAYFSGKHYKSGKS
ncbi:TPA: hypothetical protein ACN03A_004509, partial [Shigella boydii]